MDTTGRTARRTSHAVAAVLAFLAFLAWPARSGAVGVIQDDAKFFSSTAVAAATQRSQQVQQATGKTIALRTVATIGGKDDAAASAAADKVFQELQLNGVLIYVVKDAGKLVLKVGQDTRQLVPVAEETTIRNAMLARFNAKDFDGGLQTGLDALDRDLRAGAATTNGGQQGAAAPVRPAPAPTPAPARERGLGIFPLALFCLVPLVLVGLAIFFVARRRGGGPGGVTGGSGGSYPVGGPSYGGPGYGGSGGNGGNSGGGYGPNTGRSGPGFGTGAAVGGLGGLVAGGLIAHELDQRNNGGRQGNPGGDYDGGNGGGFGTPGQGQAGGYGNDGGVPSDSGQDVGGFGGDSGGGDVGSFGGGDSGGGDSGGD